MAEQDRRSIGLTNDSQALMDEILERGWFSDQQDAARFAMGLAIASGIEPGATPGVDTRWSSGLFDPTGEMLALISALYPDGRTPVRTIEHFVNEGLRMLHTELVHRGKTPADLLPANARS
jgi:hypothetical protein